tara:strand:- start:1230 stop:1442 length:213 start_codon:yes stop_codon:yes gene_type:complete
MVKYPKEKTIRGLPYDLVSTHDDKFRAKLKVSDMKRVKRTNFWGITSKVSISTRIIKTKDGRWSIYVRET